MRFLTNDVDAPFNAIRGYRPDIDGLKAVSILAVIFFHYLSSFITGGFVGVDVFFVISGYLIGRSTFIELKLKTFKFGTYFARRAKRIFPSLIILLAALWVLGAFVLLPDEYKSLGKHIGAASVFISNWLLWREIGYFDTAADEKPLLNLWSLGVEEQFYLVFPLIVLLAMRLRSRVFWVMLVLAVGSLIGSQLRVADNAGWAYYHPVSRIWELFAGSLLAYAELAQANKSGGSRFSSAVAPYRNLVSWAGIILLACSILFYTKTTVFPGVTALLPVAGAMLLISAGPDAFINKHILSKRPLIYIGLISYPLYLWHWPLIALVRVIDGMPPPTWLQAVCLVITFAVSAASYHFIERPIRFGKISKRSKLSLLLWGALLTVGAVGFMTYKFADSKLVHGQALVPQAAQLTEKRVALIGNSHAGILKDSLATYFAARGYSLDIFSQGGCTPFWNLDRHDTGHMPQGCPNDINRGMQAALNSPQIDTVIFAARFDATGSLYLIDAPETDRVGSGLPPSDAHNWTMFESSLDTTLKMLTQAQKRIIIIENVPTLSFNPKECLDRPLRIVSEMREPCAMLKTKVLADQKTYREIIGRVTQKYPNVIIFDPLPEFCDNEYCFGKIDGKALYSDRNHLTDDGVKRLAPRYNF